jgi:hypothetical protein
LWIHWRTCWERKRPADCTLSHQGTNSITNLVTSGVSETREKGVGFTVHPTIVEPDELRGIEGLLNIPAVAWSDQYLKEVIWQFYEK